MAASRNLTPEQRTLRARAAAYAQWAKEPDRVGRMAAVLEGQLRSYERQVDPEGKYAPEVRRRMAIQARKSRMAALALERSRAATARKAAAKRKGGSDG